MTTMLDAGVIILAAGKGTRMKSERNKVLHQLLGRAMVCWPLELVRGFARIVLVCGHQSEQVGQVARDFLGSDAETLRLALQQEQLGTGHAVLQADRQSEALPWVFILYADVPALRMETLQRLWNAAQQNGTLSVLTFKPPDPAGYGRIVRDRQGVVRRIVEHRDCTPEQRVIGEVNAGIYCVRRDVLFQQLKQLGTDNAQGEYYLTDVVAALADGGEAVLVDADEVQGVNTRRGLVQVERYLQQRIFDRLTLEAGVTLRNPGSTTIEPQVQIGRDSEIEAGVTLAGESRIGVGCTIGHGSVLRDVRLADRVQIKPYSVLDQVRIDGPGTVVGPFATTESALAQFGGKQ